MKINIFLLQVIAIGVIALVPTICRNVFYMKSSDCSAVGMITAVACGLVIRHLWSKGRTGSEQPRISTPVKWIFYIILPLILLTVWLYFRFLP